MQSLKLSLSYKHHFLVALFVSVWLVVFLIVIAPFDVAQLSIVERLQLMPMYGLITMIAYMLLIPLQNRIFSWLGRWPLLMEVCFIGLFNMIVAGCNYYYYKSEVVRGSYSFGQFTLEVYYPIFFILLPIIVVGRWYSNQKAAKMEVAKEASKVMLTGENRLDVLQIKLADLICISSANNYVEIEYLSKELLQKKLLRTTLKKVHLEVPDLIKVHRSHLINPAHLKEWKDANTLIMTQSEVPVSKNYRQAVLALGVRP